MFTGIVQDIGRLRSIESIEGDIRLRIAAQGLDPARLRLGDSIAVNGVCLTIVQPGTQADARVFAADVSRETLSLTTLGTLLPGESVNLEPAVRAGDALGGHWVAGHVDGLALIEQLQREARSTRVQLRLPATLARYVAPKGSVTLDGVSLTVNEAQGSTFSVNIVPHTQSVTTLAGWASGQRVNLEVDTLARYLERLLNDRRE